MTKKPKLTNLSPATHESLAISAGTAPPHKVFETSVRTYKTIMAASTQDTRQIDSDEMTHAQNLQDTLQELEGLVKEHEYILEKVRSLLLLRHSETKTDQETVMCESCCQPSRSRRSFNGIARYHEEGV
jgi:hypothetical protein